ncbi:cupredoxin domain-containing protein [Mycoavidus sp. B2-EB]|uniref:cupredoxin domain-containing protein n=1 Tax=Mycoavidus sp. B2-EB TaxID=2651972 RepID=UPI0016269C6B|nr:cupredoxin domain-containing protein [Mycoavidus sp. B2-EB]BBO59328.1 hypothetical protein MPB2EB_0444 [Mycoavidus sp. B2-EB]
MKISLIITLCATAVLALVFTLSNAKRDEAKTKEELLTFELDMADGKLTPSRIEVPANQPIKISITNSGKKAAEFESIQLRKEKVLAPGSKSFVVIKKMAPGEYKFFDDFHQATAQGVIVAR